MIKNPIPVIEVKPGDLIIANTAERIRVSSTLTNTQREIVIVYGRTAARGEVGIAHELASEVTRLV